MEQIMSDISERSYCAGWMQYLEFSLWDIIFEGKEKGIWAITDEEIKELKELANHYGGWWICTIQPRKFIRDEEGKFSHHEYVCNCYSGEAFISLSDFKRYKKRVENERKK